MPFAPPRPCRNRSCGHTTTARDGYCESGCRSKARVAANKSTPDREARQKHYHSKRHRAWRLEVLARDPVCIDCRNALSTVADHKERWWLQPDPYAYALDPANGQGMCTTCHNRKSGREGHQRAPVALGTPRGYTQQ